MDIRSKARMKRKRELEDHVVHQTSGALSLRQSSILEKKLVHGKKRLNHALKTAKGFERQKLGKRISKAQTETADTEELSRLQTEVTVLKRVDLPALAGAHLRKTLGRSKEIAALPGVLAVLTTATAPAATTAEGLDSTARNNVTARLFNTKPVRLEMTAIMAEIREILGLRSRERSVKDGAGGSSKPGGEAEGDGPDAPPSPAPSPGAPLHARKVKSAIFEVQDECDVVARFDGDPQQAHADDEEGWSHAVDGGAPKALSRAPTKPTKYDPEADLSISSAESTASSLEVVARKGGQRGQLPATAGSTFLPSLMEGYWSGSGSEAEELAEEPAKKNRRGQRARRQIWEQRFGTRANHLKQSKAEEWDARRRARPSDDGRATRMRDMTGSFTGGKETQDAGTGANVIALKSKSREAPIRVQPLHPSWQAAKKAQAQERTAKFQGKKVVFD